MSLNPELGHLYHDDSFSNAQTSLDVQEQQRTRARNARETKVLNKYTQSLDRAKGMCQRRNEWNQRRLKQELKTIEWKTPSLNRSLRIESERQKNLRPTQSASELVLPKVHASGSIITNDKILIENKKKIRYVSSWSVYSNRRSEVHSAPELYKNDSVSEFERKIYRPRYLVDDVDSGSKSANFVKKANQVSKTLHKLYADSFERKIKEQQTTVLDVLGKESKEELEKALFTLRGTTAGDLIEEILKDKEYVSKHHKGGDVSNAEGEIHAVQFPLLTDKTSATVNSLRDDRITLDGNWDGRLDTGGNTKVGTDDNLHNSSIESKVSKVETYPGSMTSLATIPADKLLRKRHHRVNRDEAMELFTRDESCFMSSTVANASDTNAVPNVLRWTDIFKTPALWQQNTRGYIADPLNKKGVSLVTLAGKRRQTMLTKR